MAAALLLNRKTCFAAPRPPVLWGDGVHDDAAAFEAWCNGDDVVWPDGTPVGGEIRGGNFLVGRTIRVGRGGAPREIVGCHFNLAESFGGCMFEFARPS